MLQQGLRQSQFPESSLVGLPHYARPDAKPASRTHALRFQKVLELLVERREMKTAVALSVPKRFCYESVLISESVIDTAPAKGASRGQRNEMRSYRRTLHLSGTSFIFSAVSFSHFTRCGGQSHKFATQETRVWRNSSQRIDIHCLVYQPNLLTFGILEA